MFDLVEGIQGYAGSYVVFAAEFFNKRLTAYQISKGNNKDVVGGQVLATKIIDDQLD